MQFKKCLMCKGLGLLSTYFGDMEPCSFCSGTGKIETYDSFIDRLSKETVARKQEELELKKRKEEEENKRIERLKKDYDEGRYIVHFEYDLEKREERLMRYNPHKGCSEPYDNAPPMAGMKVNFKSLG